MIGRESFLFIKSEEYVKKYNRDLDVIKTIDEEYKDDGILEGGRAYPLDVLNMNH